jgi:hypothetical protein
MNLAALVSPAAAFWACFRMMARNSDMLWTLPFRWAAIGVRRMSRNSFLIVAAVMVHRAWLCGVQEDQVGG